MNISEFFIERPIFAAVISTFITIAGALALIKLPVGEYPEVVPPSIVVTANYPGANPKVIADTVAAPLEQAIVGVDDKLYMSSTSTMNGTLSLTVTFKLGADVDRAQVQVQNRVAQAQPRLPQEVRDLGVTTVKSSSDLTMLVNLISPDGRYDALYLRNYAALNIRDVLARLPGMGQVQVFGGGDYAMRVWLDPEKLAVRNLTANDVVTAIREQNIDVAAGQLGAPPSKGSEFQVALNAAGRLTTEDQFRDIIVKTGANGELVRLRDLARIEMGAQDYGMRSMLDNQNAIALPIMQAPGANALQLSSDVRRTMEELKKDFPDGLDYRIAYDPTQFVRQSIEAVLHTLLEAIALVVIVVIVFLQTWRASLIPLVAVPVSIIGTFAVLLAFGFSINTLSLFGLVLAIGIVVDDAIVVVENVERHLRAGMGPREAAHVTMDEVGGALIAIALVLMAVFVPTAAISGVSGQFYKQFALTIAVATLISLIVSLTLSPALAALIMRAHPKHLEASPSRRFSLARFADWFNDGFDRLSDRYSKLVHRLVNMVGVMLIIYVALLALTGWRLAATPRGFIPAQDQGQLLIAANLPAGATLERTDAIMHQVSRICLDTPGVWAASVYAGVDATTGTTASSAGQVYLILSPFEKRHGADVQTSAVAAKLRKSLGQITGADIRVIQPPAVRGIGSTGGFKMIVEDQGGHTPQQLEQVTNQLVAAANKTPGLTNVFATYNTKTPRLFADIDRSKAEMLGVPDSAVFDTLQTYLGSTFVNEFNLFGHTFQVLAQADAPYRNDETRLTQLQTRSTSGAMVPLGSVVNVRHTTGPYRVLRYNLYPSAEVNGDTAAGFSSGQSIDSMEQLADQVLPPGYGYEWTELALQEKLAGNTGTIVFGMAVVFVFLLLAALYESVTLPLAVILIVPMCLLAAMLGVNLRGADNNILTQIGLVVLIGLAAKNAILIVEFARQGEEEHGLERHEAAAEAGRTRLRPILMTSMAFILGVAPLAFASGAGAEMRQALGVAVFSGMIGVTIFGLAFTPVFYVVCRAIGLKLPRSSTAAPTHGKPHDDAPAADA